MSDAECAFLDMLFSIMITPKFLMKLQILNWLAANFPCEKLFWLLSTRAWLRSFNVTNQLLFDFCVWLDKYKMPPTW